jgi:hypothetical protein
MSAVVLQLFAHLGVVAALQVPPSPVAELDRNLARPDDVGKQQRGQFAPVLTSEHHRWSVRPLGGRLNSRSLDSRSVRKDHETPYRTYSARVYGTHLHLGTCAGKVQHGRRADPAHHRDGAADRCLPSIGIKPARCTVPRSARRSSGGRARLSDREGPPDGLWVVAIRTVAIDAFLRSAISSGIDTIGALCRAHS